MANNKLKILVTSSILTVLLGVAACSNQPGPPVQDEEKAKASTPAEQRPEVTSQPVSKAKSRDRHAQVQAGVARKEMLMEADRYSYGVMPQPNVWPQLPVDRENYKHYPDNPVQRVAENPVSTFSIDVDTGSYSNVRRMLNHGQLPPADAVRIEELVNYFDYDYPLPEDRAQPFSVTTEIAPTPWNLKTHLLHIGIKGFESDRRDLPPANLVFLIDVSGSMHSPDKLELLKTSLKLLARQLRADDTVSIVVYAGASGVVLQPTPANRKATIIAALDRLQAGGSTNGGAGIRLAYAMAQQAYKPNGINRVILATDGDFNVGTISFEALKNLIVEKRKSGITLTTLGFGMGNLNDHLMEQLADHGNGNYAYIDTLNESNKVLVNELSSTLFTIAKDVKIQIEFNPSVVSEYRLVGYENRHLRREDFINDKVDAGDIGAGHTVTALYEITFAGNRGRIDPLRYGSHAQKTGASNNELAYLRMRYKSPEGNSSKLVQRPLFRKEVLLSLERASNNLRFSAAVAAFGELLKGGKQTGNFSYDDVTRLASKARGQDRFGYRGEFIRLVGLAQSLTTAPAISEQIRIHR